MIEKNIVRSIDNLLDKRSKKLFLKHKLFVGEIFPLYLEFQDKGSEMYKLLNDKNAPLEIYEKLKKQLASYAIISYELAKRDEILFEDKENPHKIIGVRRFALPEHHAHMGETYEKSIKVVEETRKKGLEEAIARFEKGEV